MLSNINCLHYFVAQLVERQISNLKVSGSNPEKVSNLAFITRAFIVYIVFVAVISFL